MDVTFQAFSMEHAVPVVVAVLFGWLVIAVGLRSDERVQRLIGTGLALIVLMAIFCGSVILYVRGDFDPKEDLPLYLCRVIAWTLPFVMWKQNRRWLGIFYFWILAGTFQGLITPDLAEGFPDYFYFRYWFLHAGLVVTIIYGLVVYKVRITWTDFWRAVLYVQFYIVAVHLVNIAIGSNYSYTVQKPPGGSVADFLGPWPWYILGGEVIMFILSLLLMLPFVISGGFSRVAIRNNSRDFRQS